MLLTSTKKRENRTITIDFNDEATYHELCKSGTAFIDFVVGYIMSLGFNSSTDVTVRLVFA